MTDSLPLSKVRHEVFAKERAAGASLATAWRAGAANGVTLSDDSARASGWRCQAREEVAARIANLQAEAASQRHMSPSAATLSDKTHIEWMREICAVLRQTAEAFEHLPLHKRSKLKSVYAAHLARLHKMEGDQAPTIYADGTNPILANMKACTCH